MSILGTIIYKTGMFRSIPEFASFLSQRLLSKVVMVDWVTGFNLSRLINGVGNLTVVLQKAVPKLTHSLVGTLDSITHVVRPLGNVTGDLVGVVEEARSGILPLQKMTLETAKLLDTVNTGLAPMQNITVGVVELVETSNKTMMAATMALILAIVALLICLAVLGMCGLYYFCYKKNKSQTKCCRCNELI